LFYALETNNFSGGKKKVQNHCTNGINAICCIITSEIPVRVYFFLSMKEVRLVKTNIQGKAATEALSIVA